LRLTSEQAQKFQTYMELLLEWNTKINLTAIKEPKEFVEKHFLDSLWPLQWLNLAGKTCLDVGTGAGFPGIPLKL
ncbi:MAG TPA: 16S rRNA (guanine(527)-N(7))-methyltransferase RsmG, partial [Ruminococcaceae bacterium]|nr:16S rRNA (guanine(527)-N(7))-methyltransferase RsmG [Oscillospiraceae bacterium]